MRGEQEMMARILDAAQRDVRVRAAYMNGSRANPNAPKDRYRDFDVVYVVRDVGPFRDDPSWIDVFGERAMLQEPDRLDAYRGVKPQEDVYVYLILLADGNRIDLAVETVASMLRGYRDDSLTVPLLDKDGILPSIDPPSERTYHVQPPSEGAYIACLNNFFWCLQNVAKGIVRGEWPYARSMFEQVIRPELDSIVSWWIALRHPEGVNAGKMGKWFPRLLPPGMWALYKQTMTGWDGLWEAMDAACALAREMGRAIAGAYGFLYPQEDDGNMTAYLAALRQTGTQHDHRQV